MNRIVLSKLLTVLISALALVACEGDRESMSDSTQETTAKPATAVKKPGAAIEKSPGKLTAPISFDYSIVGNPIVGQPVSINLQISSPLDDRTITVFYRVNEAGSLTFPESQLETITLLPLAEVTSRNQQVTVVPQREGRIYLVVSAEVETDGGTMMRSMSIPIQVGNSPRAPTVNGELVEGPDGEVGISMPAKEP
ncbi:MAG: hypothetical protein GXP15_08600 [Gammaproteobacteria bacterium]|nr:hypothetical protein [Gammaproteobacteria bacterium]